MASRSGGDPLGSGAVRQASSIPPRQPRASRQRTSTLIFGRAQSLFFGVDDGEGGGSSGLRYPVAQIRVLATPPKRRVESVRKFLERKHSAKMKRHISLNNSFEKRAGGERSDKVAAM